MLIQSSWYGSRFSGIPIPAKSTIHAVLDRHGLVERRGRARRRVHGTPLSLGQRPNQLWCTDYKGEFLLGNQHYCYPLTVTDHASMNVDLFGGATIFLERDQSGAFSVSNVTFVAPEPTSLVLFSTGCILTFAFAVYVRDHPYLASVLNDLLVVFSVCILQQAGQA
jgi:hypothetical protein